MHRDTDGIMAEVRGLTVRFGDVTAVDGVSFEVRRGEVFGFLGPNGAGKTTTIRAVTTLQRPTSGTVLIDGFDASEDYLEARRRIGIAQQHISLDKDLTVRQNIRQHALLHKIPRSEIDDRIRESAELMGLEDQMDRRVQDLSGGWRRKASIVCAIVHRPELLLLDEPTAGLDTRSRHMLWDLVRDLNARGTTIFLTTHYIEEAESLCDRVGIIDRGRLVAADTVDALRDSLGRVTVDVTSNGRRESRHFATREEAKAYAASLGDVDCGIRRTSLEDVYLELTGGGPRWGSSARPTGSPGATWCT
ncbi:MAG: ABC transporter ATP-binding protein [Thermoplasmata archaeon]|nr:ABC transporter ATP-binding protein [Thermoplasmata archaeon]